MFICVTTIFCRVIQQEVIRADGTAPLGGKKSNHKCQHGSRATIGFTFMDATASGAS